MAQMCHAQKLRRHEITVGHYGGYYFDETPFRFQNIKPNKRIPTITYSYWLNKYLKFNFLYGTHDYGYLKGDNSEFSTMTNFVTGRTLRNYKVSVSKVLNNSRFGVFPEIAINYRTGFKAKFLYYYNHGNWVESFFEYKDYKDVGLSLGISFRHPIVKRFFGELSVNYIRYFSDFDKNLLMPGYRIGFRF
jgi:hypothetical protein